MCGDRDDAPYDELNVLIRGCLEENENLHLVVVGPDVSSADVADRIGCDVSRVGGAVGRFEIEDSDVLTQGRGAMLNMIRRWWMSRNGSGPYEYGTDAEF
ncbi:MAG: hypothetical protein JWM85_1871 [Acidimicrobiaceae bacterium]|nr:hypothetical protein [Acidimicrobiaceae bacterium]